MTTRAQIVSAMRQLGHLRMCASSYEAGHFDEAEVIEHIEIDCWRYRSEEWRERALPVIRALRDLGAVGSLHA